jgi:hypothetical protein
MKLNNLFVAGAFILGGVLLGLALRPAKQAPLRHPRVGESMRRRIRVFNDKDQRYFVDELVEMKVIDVQNGRVRSVSSQGDTYVNSINPFLPPYELNVKSETSNNHSEYNEISGDPLAIWPLKVGKRSSNRIIGNIKNMKSDPWNYVFECEVTSRGKIGVQAGEFKNTFVVVCKSHGSINGTTTYHYDAGVGRVVSMEQVTDDRLFIELVDFYDP